MATCLIYEIRTGDGNICYKNTEKDAIAFARETPAQAMKELL